MSSDEEEDELVCRLSHPAHPHTLVRKAGLPLNGCFGGGRQLKYWYLNIWYYCTTCDVEFHKGCHQSPRKMTHPYHPQHSLIFSALNTETGIINDSNFHDHLAKESIVDSGISNHGNIFYRCSWCSTNSMLCTFFFRCSVCNFCLCASCSKKYPLPAISNPKSHPHSLTFLPRQAMTPCDACGWINEGESSYACFQCNYMVHKSCIDLPRVIKLTRHPHRLIYTPFLSTTSPSCRLCYCAVDIKYGQYSCNQYDCSYVVHSKCATQKNVWDARELEWQSEEPETPVEDVVPFKIVGDDLIKYFCHEHHLKLEKYNRVRDGDKQCQACILHIDSRNFYNCTQCDFFLHEICANLPRKLEHSLHRHPLILDPIPLDDYYTIGCLVCSRKFTGFRYKCSNNNCEDAHQRKFQVDVRCILFPDCFTHKSHEHPLFIPITNQTIFCEGCKAKRGGCYLQCTLCKFAICYKCATMPDKLHYRYDALPLSLCYGEISDDTYWCEVCEEKLDPKNWFYTSDKPDIYIHSSCVFGSSAYMKSGYEFYIMSSCEYITVQVLSNISSTRPICRQCGRRCSYSVYFELSDDAIICSFSCFLSYVEKLYGIMERFW